MNAGARSGGRLVRNLGILGSGDRPLSFLIPSVSYMISLNTHKLIEGGKCCYTVQKAHGEGWKKALQRRH